MSRSNDLPPYSPKPKSSNSGIFSAFKNMTGSKSRPSEQTSPSTDGPTSPLSSVSPNTSALQGGETLHPEPLSLNGNSSSATSRVMGGPPELQLYMEKLDSKNLIATRLKAAEDITAILKDYTVDNVTAIWKEARDLLQDSMQEATDAGYTLLSACIRHKPLTSSDRRYFFDAVNEDQRAETYSVRFQVLSELTNVGRNLEALELVAAPAIVRLLKQAYETARSARKQEKSSKAASSPSEKQLSHIFRYLLDVAKFSSKSLSDSDLEVIIESLVAICNKTTSASDLENSVDIINAMVTYAHVPNSSLRSCTEVLCGIYCQIPSVKDKSWSAIENLLRSHLGPIATEALLAIMRENPYLEDRQYHSIRGAVLVLQQLFTLNDAEFTLPAIRELMASLKASLTLQSAKLASEIMLLIYSLLQQDRYIAQIMENNTWSNFTAVITRCTVRKSDPKEAEGDKEMIATVTSSVGLQKVADCLVELSAHMDFEQKHMIAELLRSLSSQLNDDTARFVIEHYMEERLLFPSNEQWLENWHNMHDSMFKDNLWSSETRALSFQALLDAYYTAEAMNNPQANGLILVLISRIREEPDPVILNAILDFCVETATSTSEESIFEAVLNNLSESLVKFEDKSRTSSPVVVGSFGLLRASISGPSVDSFSAQVAKALVSIFLRSLNRSATKAQNLYKTLLMIAESDRPPVDARIITLKLLFRLRSDVNHALFVIPYTDCDSLAASLCRTEASASGTMASQEQLGSRTPRSEDLSSKKQSQPSSPSQLGRSGSQSRRAASGFTSRVTKPVPPLWFYPGPKGLPEDPPAAASHLLYTRSAKQGSADSAEGVENELNKVIKTSLWLELVIRLMQQDDLHWELYSYIIVHLGAQLTNHSLFVDAVPQVRFLRSVVCQQLSNKTFHEPPGMTNIKKSDVAICVYDILTMLISYTHHFSKNEEDEIVKVFVFGIGSWERTSECCMHALAICCHEIPLSLSKSLENLLHKLSQIITQSQIAVHILEFLTGLARLSELYKNFREEEFKMVFGICFRYLQYVRDQRNKAAAPQPPGSRPSTRTGRQGTISREMSRDYIMLAEKESGPKTLSDSLPQYVYSLTYHVMTFWYMSLKLQDRARQIPWIIKNLVYLDSHGVEVMEEQAQVLVDMMYLVAYSDLDETHFDPDFAKPADGTVSSKSWLIGTSVVTMDTASRTGLTQLTRRRPSGTRYSIYRPQHVKPPRHQIPVSGFAGIESSYEESFVAIMPDDMIQAFYSPLMFSSPSTTVESPVSLPEDDMTRRTIGAFDRISPLDGHKVGVIYVGETQTNESEILANVMGSADYTQFLQGMGTLIELKGANFNTQGLDREFDTDGKFTFAWRDRVTEIIFHVTTMMPTNTEHDPSCTNKKKHIGNDFINIIFNNSGLPFDINTFPSDFNFVNIIITPEARASFVETRLQAAKNRRTANTQDGIDMTSSTENQELSEDPDLYYKVTVLTKPGIPRISPAADTKVISGRCLPSLVRLIALNSSYFAQEWANRDLGNEHVSSWRSRLREIMRLRDKFVDKNGHAIGIGIAPPVTNGASNITPQLSAPSADVDSPRPNNRSATPNHAATPSTGSSAATTGGGGVSLPPPPHPSVASTAAANGSDSGSAINTTPNKSDRALLRRGSAATFLSDDNRSSGLGVAATTHAGGSGLTNAHASGGVEMERGGSGRSAKSGSSK